MNQMHNDSMSDMPNYIITCSIHNNTNDPTTKWPSSQEFNLKSDLFSLSPSSHLLKDNTCFIEDSTCYNSKNFFNFNGSLDD